MKRLNIEGIEVIVEYKPKNRNSYIAISPDGTVRLRTPMRMAFRIKSLLRSRLEWIKEKRLQAAKKPRCGHTLGQTVLFEGIVHDVTAIPKLYGMIERLHVKDESSLQQCYDRFYLKEAKKRLPLHVEHLEKETALVSKALKYRKMKRQWGNCNTKGIITFNTALMMLPSHLQRYVVLHELCHLKHMNHSRDFYALLYCHMPQAPEYERELKIFLTDI